MWGPPVTVFPEFTSCIPSQRKICSGFLVTWCTWVKAACFIKTLCYFWFSFQPTVSCICTSHPPSAWETHNLLGISSQTSFQGVAAWTTFDLWMAQIQAIKFPRAQSQVKRGTGTRVDFRSCSLFSPESWPRFTTVFAPFKSSFCRQTGGLSLCWTVHKGFVAEQEVELISSDGWKIVFPFQQ